MITRIFAIGLLLLLTPGSDAGTRSSQPVAQGPLHEAIAAERQKPASARSLAERRDMEALYDRGAGGPVWIDAAGKPAAQARAGLTLLDQAASQGLDPAAYGVAELATLVSGLDGPAPAAVTRAARFDVLMTAGVLRYFRDVHLGRVDPRTLGNQLTFPTE
jgi:murein L,D-transpeptidase YcbB/YkuD